MDRQRRLAATALGSLAMFLGAVQAAPFNERVKAPKASDLALHAQLETYFDTYEKKGARADPAGFIRDRAAYKQWADAEFLFMRALDEGRQLDDLAAFGFVVQPDGTYRVDRQEFPQWQLLDERLRALEDLDSLDRYVPALKARGFRNADVEALRTYVATHDPRQLLHGEGKELIDSFAKRVQKRYAAGQPPDFDEAMDFRYQVDSLNYESQRQWAIGLMDTLDRQRQRILVSLLDEQPRSVRGYAGIREPLNQAWLQFFQLYVSGEYVETIEKADEELARDLAARQAKLRGKTK